MKRSNILLVSFIIFTILGLYITTQSSNVFRYILGFGILSIASVLGLFRSKDLFKKNNKKGLLSLPFVLVPFFLAWGLESEIMKSDKILTASTFGNSFGNWHVILRKNGRYEIVASNLLGNDNYKGKYQINGSKILLLDKDDEADYIPDTLRVYCQKIPLFFDEEGRPILQNDSYLRIHDNKLIIIDEDCPDEFEYDWELN